MSRYPKSVKVTVKRVEPKPVVKRVAYGLNTDNYGRFLTGLLSSVASAGDLSTTLVDSGGNSRTLWIKSGYTYASQFITSRYVGTPVELRVFAQLGTGTTSPARNNFKLETPIAGDIPLSSNYANGVVSLTGSYTYANAVSPSEAGLFVELGNGTSGAKSPYLMDRTTFTPLPAGTTFTVRFDISLG